MKEEESINGQMEEFTMENGKMTRSMVSSEMLESERVGKGVFKLPGGAVCDGEWKDG